VQDYIILPIYLSNIVTISGDASEIRVLYLPVEFQVIEQITIDFLIERDAIRAYKTIIDEELDQIIFPTCSPAFYISIAKTSHEKTQKTNARVFTIESISILQRKEFKSSGDDIRPLSIIIDDKDEWTIECINDEHVTPHEITQYLIWWKVYNTDERIWQTLNDLTNIGVSVLTWKTSRAEMVRPLRQVPRRSPRKSVYQSKHPRL
jgi:hypothetical protein